MDDLDFGETNHGLKSGLKVFNRFTLIELVGRGGMAQVWSARDEELGSLVALKFLRELVTTDRAAIGELKREVRRCRELTHPHIVRVNDFHQQGQVAGISMELVDGDTLANLRMDQLGEVFSPEQLAPWVTQLCAALEYAHHEAQVVHRDLKPSNLMVDAKGRIKVTDFGIARSLTDSLSRLSNQTSSGTLLYMSPQQLRGEDPTPADDLYALGATLYELLTGRPPFKSGDIAGQIKGEMPVSPSQRRREAGLAELPSNWEHGILRLLEKQPGPRREGVGALLAKSPILPGPRAVVVRAPPPQTRSTPKRATTGRGFRVAIGAAALSTVGLAAAYWFLLRPGLRADEAIGAAAIKEAVEIQQATARLAELRREQARAAARDRDEITRIRERIRAQILTPTALAVLAEHGGREWELAEQTLGEAFTESAMSTGLERTRQLERQLPGMVAAAQRRRTQAEFEKAKARYDGALAAVPGNLLEYWGGPSWKSLQAREREARSGSDLPAATEFYRQAVANLPDLLAEATSREATARRLRSEAEARQREAARLNEEAEKKRLAEAAAQAAQTRRLSDMVGSTAARHAEPRVLYEGTVKRGLVNQKFVDLEGGVSISRFQLITAVPGHREGHYLAVFTDGGKPLVLPMGGVAWQVVSSATVLVNVSFQEEGEEYFSSDGHRYSIAWRDGTASAYWIKVTRWD